MKNTIFYKGGLQNMWFLRSFALWRDQQINFFSFFGLLAAPGVSWGPPGGSSWAPPGSFLGLPGGLLGSLGALLEPRGTHVGLPEPDLGAPGD